MRVTPAPLPFVRLARLAALGVPDAAHRFFSEPGVASTSPSSSRSSSWTIVNRVERDVDPILASPPMPSETIIRDSRRGNFRLNKWLVYLSHVWNIIF